MIECTITNNNIAHKWLQADNGKVASVIEYSSGNRVSIPLNSSGTVKWFDDSVLLKKEEK